jgi:hypothetical protein
MKTAQPGSKKLLLGLVAAVVVLAIAGIIYWTGSGPKPAFTPVEWGIYSDVLGEGQHVIALTANVEPMLPDEVQEISGSLVWPNMTVILCSGYPAGILGLNVLDSDEAFPSVTIGDVFESASQYPGCATNDSMAQAFTENGSPDSGCLKIKTKDVWYEFCAPLDVLPPG